MTNDLSTHEKPVRQMAGRGVGVRCNSHVYRVIEASQAALWRNAFQQGICRRLINQGLIAEMELVENQTGVVLRQAAMTVESCPHEWCAPMLRDAARAVLNTCIQLARRGYTFNRIGADTVQFDGSQAVVADLTSLTPIGDESTWLGYPEFAARFLYPLIMMVNGHDALARIHLASGGVSEDVLQRHVPIEVVPASLRARWRSESGLAKISRPIRRWWRGSVSAKADCDSRQRDAVVRKLQWAREELEELAPGIDVVVDRRLPPVNSRLEQLLASLNPGRVLQWGGGSPIEAVDSIFCDASPREASRWFGLAATNKLRIVSLVVDLSQPLPQGGRSAIERLRSEMLVVQADQGLLSPLPSTLNAHLDWLVQWTDRWMLVQLPREWPSAPAGLVVALQRRFASVLNLTGDESSGPMLLCEK